jgi:hypothetical protein
MAKAPLLTALAKGADPSLYSAADPVPQRQNPLCRFPRAARKCRPVGVAQARAIAGAVATPIYKSVPRSLQKLEENAPMRALQKVLRQAQTAGRNTN